jgi:hypothetical protein
MDRDGSWLADCEPSGPGRHGEPTPAGRSGSARMGWEHVKSAERCGAVSPVLGADGATGFRGAGLGDHKVSVLWVDAHTIKYTRYHMFACRRLISADSNF